MRILWVTSKAPWPPCDGGRLLVAETVRALAARGHDVRVVAVLSPGSTVTAAYAGARSAGVGLNLVDAPPRGWVGAGIAAAATGRALTFVRHARPALARAVAASLHAHPSEVVIAEQPQLFAACRDAVGGRLPLVLRAQNVEARLWEALAATTSWSRPLVAAEARRVARDEISVVRQADLVAAVTASDRDALASAVGPDARIEHVPPAFPAAWPATGRRLEGSPALVLLGSASWVPNRDGNRWFEREVWPAIVAESPAAVLHGFDGRETQHGRVGERVVRHAAPAESGEAFAPGSVLIVPLRIAAGIRMKVLEAWARGIPVVATSAALSGLDVEPGRQALVADSPVAFARAVRALVVVPGLAASLVAAGRERLVRRYDPERVARRWEELLTPLARR